MSQQSSHPDLNEQFLDVLTNFHEGHSVCKQEFQEEIVPVFKSLAETIDFSLEVFPYRLSLNNRKTQSRQVNYTLRTTFPRRDNNSSP